MNAALASRAPKPAARLARVTTRAAS